MGRLFALSAGGTIAGVSSLVTGVMLLGLAGGTYLGYPYCKARHLDMYRLVVKCAFLACVFTYILVPLYSNMLVMSVFLGFIIWIPLVLAIYVAIGSIVPILCHVTKRHPARSVGRLVGEGLRSLFIGRRFGYFGYRWGLNAKIHRCVAIASFLLSLVGLTALLLPWLDANRPARKN